MRIIGQVDGQFDLPLTQEGLGDSLGLTAVRINRVLKRLRDERLIALKHKRLTLLDPRSLTAIIGFGADYLHLVKRTAEHEAQSGLG